MSEPWESLGEYALQSYTKVDVWEHNNRFNISTNAVHEYAHAYMIKASNYGSYLMCLLQIIKSHSERINDYTGNQRDEFIRKIQRIAKILYALHENMKIVQETIASLVEILYVCHIRGYEEGIEYLWNMGSYLIYVEKFKYLIDKSYLEDAGKQYLEYLKTSNSKLYNALNKYNKSNPEIFLGISMLLDIGVFALNINKFECTKEQWAYPNAFINTQLKSFKYHPDKRFKSISEKVIGPGCAKWETAYLELFKQNIALNEIKEQVKTLTDFSYVSDDFELRETDTHMIDGIVEVEYGLASLKDLESFSVLTAIPSITCKNSINKFYTPDKYDVLYVANPKESDQCSHYLREARTIGIKYAMTYGDRYNLRIDKRLEDTGKWLSPKLGITNWDLGNKVAINVGINLFNSNLLMHLMDRNIVLYGNYGLEDLIKRLNEKEKLHYVYLSNNLRFLYGFIKELVKENDGKANATFIKTKECNDVLVIKSKSTIAFQPMINRYIEHIQADYNLVFCKHLVDRETESMISRILNCCYEDDAYYVGRKKDRYTVI